jgi:hypothetical protein
LGLSVGGYAGEVGAGAGAAADAGDGDGAAGAVQQPVSAAVEPVPDGLAAAGRDRASVRPILRARNARISAGA